MNELDRLEARFDTLKSESEADRAELRRLRRSRERWLRGMTLAVVALGLGAWALAAAAPGDAVPNNFATGQSIDAAAMNANFSELSAQTGELDTRLATQEQSALRKGNLYQNDVTGPIAAMGANTVTVFCNDPNDVALTGGCYTAADEMRLFANGPDAPSYLNSMLAAGWICSAQSFRPTATDLTAKVVCLTVP